MDLGEAILRCREEVEDDKNIIVDIILCFPAPVYLEKWTTSDARQKSAYEFSQRKEEMKIYNEAYEDVVRTVRGYPNVNFRYLITPSEVLPTQWFPIFATDEEI